MTTVLDAPVTVTDLVAAVRRQQVGRTVAPAESLVKVTARSVCVIAAHPGAGATAVAVATTDALAATGRAVVLVDGAATPDAFGAAEVEIDSGTPGARAGRRGLVTILRPEAVGLDAVQEVSVTVIDGDVGASARRVVVCRPTLPSVGKAERLLTDDSLLAVVGASRWPKVLPPAMGPRVTRALDDRRSVFFPHHRGLEIHGVDPEPTPASLLAAGSRLIELLWPDRFGSACQHRWAGKHRWKGLRR